jgi:hypothetical protein
MTRSFISYLRACACGSKGGVDTPCWHKTADTVCPIIAFVQVRSCCCGGVNATTNFSPLSIYSRVHFIMGNKIATFSEQQLEDYQVKFLFILLFSQCCFGIRRSIVVFIIVSNFRFDGGLTGCYFLQPEGHFKVLYNIFLNI